MTYPDYSAGFREIVGGLEFTSDGRLAELESCDESLGLLLESFANHLESVQHIDLNALPEELMVAFYHRLTARMNTALDSLEGLSRGDTVRLSGNTMALISESNGNAFYPQVLSRDKHIRGILDKMMVLRLPNQSGMDLVRIEANSPDAEETISKYMTHDIAGLAMVLRGTELITIDPNVETIPAAAMVLVPIHYRNVSLSRETAQPVIDPEPFE